MRLNLKSRKQISLVVLIVLAITFIFAQSSMPGDMSSKEAHAVGAFIDKIAIIFMNNQSDTEKDKAEDLTDNNESSSSSDNEEILSPEQKPEEPSESEPIVSVVFLRKLAHFLEHGVLGLLVFLFLCAMDKELYKYIKYEKNSLLPFELKFIPYTLSFGMFIALLDETVQIFSKRGTSVKDIWIDLFGYVTFTAISYIIALISNSIKLRKNVRI